MSDVTRILDAIAHGDPPPAATRSKNGAFVLWTWDATPQPEAKQP